METLISVDDKKTKLSKRDLANFIKIRQALPADDLSVAELLTSTFIETYQKKLPTVNTPDSRKQELVNVADRRKNGHTAVAELGYRIIGTFALIHPESKASEAWRPNGATLRCVAVHPEFHGLGLSSLLLHESERVATFWRCNAIYLHVQSEAEKVSELYEKHGYVRDVTGDKFSHGSKIIGYYKNIAPYNSHAC